MKVSELKAEGLKKSFKVVVAKEDFAKKLMKSWLKLPKQQKFKNEAEKSALPKFGAVNTENKPNRVNGNGNGGVRLLASGNKSGGCSGGQEFRGSESAKRWAIDDRKTRAMVHCLGL